MKGYLIPATILIAGAGLFFTFRKPQSYGLNSNLKSATDSAEPVDLARPPQTKSKIRIDRPRPTIVDTTELLENTILPVVNLPGQPLSERVLAINQLLENIGVPPDQLRVSYDKFNPVSTIQLGELKTRNISAAALLRRTAGDSDLRIIVREGRVEITIPESDSID